MLLTLDLPDWLAELERDTGPLDDAAAMRLAICAAEHSIDDGGGPFGAAVVDGHGRIIGVGANRVIPAHASFLHAEMLALLRAQQRLGTHDLGRDGALTLFTSCAPCAMCLGALPFAGIAAVVCGARAEDAEAAGFDEGAKPADWIGALRQRGITVTTDFLREEAVAPLLRYRRLGRPVY